MYFIEITDTYGGEANYCWKREYLTVAKSPLGAIRKLQNAYGGYWKKDYDCGDMVRYNQKGACVCAFVRYVDDSIVNSFYPDTAKI